MHRLAECQKGTWHMELGTWWKELEYGNTKKTELTEVGNYTVCFFRCCHMNFDWTAPNSTTSPHATVACQSQPIQSTLSVKPQALCCQQAASTEWQCCDYILEQHAERPKVGGECCRGCSTLPRRPMCGKSVESKIENFEAKEVKKLKLSSSLHTCVPQCVSVAITVTKKEECR
jgi:hypothetical protein